MKGQPKKKKRISLARAVFANNLDVAMKRVYAQAKSDTQRRRQLEGASGIAKETLRRWLTQAGNAPNLDNIEAVAEALKMQPFQLLMPPAAGESASQGPTKIPPSRPAEKAARPPSIDPR